jgi:hypothetical protein
MDPYKLQKKKFCECSTWFPDLLQHLDVQAELICLELVSIVLAEAGKAETLIPPVLAEVAIHGVVLSDKK